jgi:hypothetical protein
MHQSDLCAPDWFSRQSVDYRARELRRVRATLFHIERCRLVRDPRSPLDCCGQVPTINNRHVAGRQSTGHFAREFGSNTWPSAIGIQ